PEGCFLSAVAFLLSRLQWPSSSVINRSSCVAVRHFAVPSYACQSLTGTVAFLLSRLQWPSSSVITRSSCVAVRHFAVPSYACQSLTGTVAFLNYSAGTTEPPHSSSMKSLISCDLSASTNALISSFSS